MNIQHLRYAIEVANTSSINKAAENLFMNQPNLSRSIKELEKSIGINIFNRTTKGISVTKQGKEFLFYAKDVIRQIDKIEAMYTHAEYKKNQFSICVPSAQYIASAFTHFAKKINKNNPLEINYKETNGNITIENVLKNNFNLGIIRYNRIYDDYVKKMLYEKELSHEFLCQFSYILITSINSPLLELKNISTKDLNNFLEIAYTDPYEPITSSKLASMHEKNTNKKIYVSERNIQFELLENISNTFMWISPIEPKILLKHKLVKIDNISENYIYKDILIRQKDYHLSELDKLFLTELSSMQREHFI